MPISSAPQRLRQEDQVFEASLRQFEDNPVRKDGREGGKEKKQSSVLYQNTFFFFNCAKWGTLWHLQKFLEYIKYIILEFITPQILGTISTDLIFLFTYMCA
jgi:hypothetical protein